MKTKKFSFKGVENKILKSFLLSLLGFLCTWLLANYQSIEILEQYPMIGAFAPAFLNAVLNFIKEQK